MLAALVRQFARRGTCRICGAGPRQGTTSPPALVTRHGAHPYRGLLTKTAATIAARTLLLVCLTRD